ncbi:MAG: hypothetical protein IJ093_02265 [Bacilli bacterium]|nr:hypothetical protein [Bacilli bacterium]
MSTGILFIFIALIFVFVLETNNHFSSRKFVKETEPYFRFLMEDDYEFLLKVKYGNITSEDVEKLYGQRIRNGLVVIVFMFFIFLNNLTFVYVVLSVILGFLMFKLQYTQLKSYYKANLHKINLMLPYYLKSLEILIQHYTVPVAIGKSIDSAPEIFKPGLQRLIDKIDAGDSSVQPYMDFANEYPVRDSMRMMRLLYRLGLGSQQNKQEQLLMFSRTISALQNKAREQKYQERLDKMEQKTMIMLFGTGGGTLVFLLLSMMMMMNL